MEYSYNSVSEYILSHSRKNPDKTALIFNEEIISYFLLGQRAHKLATYLLETGVKPGDRIAYALRSQPLFFYSYLAAGLIGATVVGLAYNGSPEYASRIIEENNIVGIICEDEQLDKYRSICDEKIFIITEKCLENLDSLNIDYKAIDEYSQNVDIDDDFIILYTSGTTSSPKGAVLSHRNAICSALMQNRYLFDIGFTENDIVNHSFPVNHVSGAIECGIGPLIAGGSLILFSVFNPKLILQSAEKYDMTVICGVPAMWIKITEEYDKGIYNLRNLRFGISGAAPLSIGLAERITDIAGACANPMGMTETSGFCSGYRQETTAEKCTENVGCIMPDLQYKIIDDKGKILNSGETGQICYKGDSVIKRYTSHSLALDEDGYFMSGDLGYTDSNNKLHICGRNDDMFTVGGYNVFPEEIEEILRQYNGICDAVVVPVPHHSMGNVCLACVRTKGTVDFTEVENFLKIHLMHYKVPRQFVVMDKFPINGLGKIDRKSIVKNILENK